jgi:hypothetical protein
VQLVHHSELLKVHRNALGQHPLALLDGRESNIWAALVRASITFANSLCARSQRTGAYSMPLSGPRRLSVPQREAVRC